MPAAGEYILAWRNAMRESRFSVHKFCTVDGHEVRVEKRSLFFTMEYSLIIDGVKQDQLLGTYGLFVLHGVIDQAGPRSRSRSSSSSGGGPRCSGASTPAGSSRCRGTILKLDVALRGLRFGSSYVLRAATGRQRPPLVGAWT